MQIRNITNHSGIKELLQNHRDKIGEVARFGIVGVLATALQYVVYWSLLRWLDHNVSLTIGYIVSFVFNFIASTYFTFRVKASTKRGVGFAFSHLVNWLLQMALLNFFIWVGMDKEWAPLPMFCICIPVNFLLVRYFLKVKNKE